MRIGSGAIVGTSVRNVICRLLMRRAARCRATAGEWRGMARKRRCFIFLLVICCFFAIISAYQCLTVPFSQDEQLPYINYGSGYESNGCLYYYVFSFISSAWGEYPSDYRNRILCWGLGLAAIPLLFWIGRSINDSFTGLLVAFLLAANVAHLAAASYHRFYTINECCTILATGLCLWACRGRSWSRWGWYLLAMLAAVASMLLSLLLLLIHLAIVLLASSQRSVALKRFAWAALLCSLFWGWLVYRDRFGLDRFYYGDFGEKSVIIMSDMILGYGGNRDSVVSYSQYLEGFVAPAKRAGNGSLQILKWLTLLAGIGIWRWRRSAAWKNLARVKLALVAGLGCIIAVSVAYSLGVRNLIVASNFICLIPYVVLILGLAMRTSRVFRIAMLTVILLASPYLSLLTTIWGAYNNVLIRYAVSHRRAGEVIVFDELRTVSLPAAWQKALNVPHFRHNAPGVVNVSIHGKGMLRFLHTLFWAETTPWRRVWLLTKDRPELKRYLGNGCPVRLGNHTVHYLKTFGDNRLELYYIIIEPYDASEGEEL